VVELTSCRLGGDLTGDRVRLASRVRTAGATLINAVGDYDLTNGATEIRTTDSELYFSVSESEAVIKRVGSCSDSNLDRRQAALFELTVSLIDDTARYYLDAYDLNGDEEKLAVAYNRQCVDRNISLLTEQVCKPTGFKLRSLSLADGYRHYCRPVGGELICLLDFSSTVCSYSFLYHNRPILLGAVAGLSKNADATDDINEACIIDITATLKFQLAALFASGKSALLSRIVISGPNADEKLLEHISSKMKAPTEFPTLNSTLFAPGVVAEAGSYLVSLGLTVDG